MLIAVGVFAAGDTIAVAVTLGAGDGDPTTVGVTLADGGADVLGVTVAGAEVEAEAEGAVGDTVGCPVLPAIETPV